VGVTIKLSPFESHNSLGQNERLHSPLRRCFLKIRNDIPSLPDDVALRVAVKAINDTVGPNGLIPTLLVFGTMPQLPLMQGTLSPYTGQEQRDHALRTATAEYRKYVSERRLQTALRAKTATAMTCIHQPGDRVLVYRERPQLWEGPYSVVMQDGKIVTVKLNDETSQQRFNVSNVKPYQPPDIPSTVIPDHLQKPSHQPSLNDHADSVDEESLVYRVMVTEIISPGDPRGNSPEFLQAKLDELQGLKNNGTWEEVWETDLPADANKMRGRFVLTIKHKGTNEEVLKARFVAQGFCDSEKSTLVHTAVLARQASTRVVVSLARAFGWDIHSHDVTQAYLQADNMHRAVYIKPPAELNLKGKFLFLVKPLYGLTDAGDLWYHTLSKFIKNTLAMHELISDPGVMFSSHSSGTLLGMILTYVDDLLIAGCSAFLERSLAIDDRFKSRPRQINKFTHAGIDIQRQPNMTTLSQSDYADRLRRLPKLCHFEGFRSARAKLQWLVNTRPDIAGSVSLLAQVTPEQYEQDHAKHNSEINRVIRYV
jgi:Reverse transcriptase (RNA-dependent DNA polymerase)